MIRALVFDFDGLILDTEGPIYQSWQELYEARGVPLPFEMWVQTVGSSNQAFDPQRYLEGEVGSKLPQDVLERRVRRRAELVLAQPVLPGVIQLADAAIAMGLKVGVASSSTCDWVTGHLERLGILDRFDCLRGRDDVEHVKPEPDLYISILDCLDVAAAEALAIEDSPNGIVAAKRAGLRCVVVPNPITARLDLSQADLRLASLADVTLPQLLDHFPSPARGEGTGEGRK